MEFTSTQLLTAGALVFFFAYRRFRQSQVRKLIPGLLKEGAVIVDVRTPGEFQSAHNPASINLPLDRLAQDWEKIPKDRPVILCCASGMRSGAALRILRGKGLNHLVNAGPWSNTLTEF